MDVIRITGYVDEDGQLHTSEQIALPSGQVEITIQPVQDDAPLTEEEIKALLISKPVTGAELVNNPAIGIWADREDMQDTEAYVDNLRRNRWVSPQ